MDLTLRVSDVFAGDTMREFAAVHGIIMKNKTDGDLRSYGGKRGIMCFVRDFAYFIIEDLTYKRSDDPDDGDVIHLIISEPEIEEADTESEDLVDGNKRKLLPCPFCGEKSDFVIQKLMDPDGNTGRVNYGCAVCGALGGSGRDENDAAKKWNYRFKGEKE